MTRNYNYKIEHFLIVTLLLAGFILSAPAFVSAQRAKKPSAKKPTKSTTVTQPKGILLDVNPTWEESGDKLKKPITPSDKIANHCSGSLFCPDVGEIFNALEENKDRFSKGKFEKTADGEKRMLTVLNEVKFSNGKTAADKMVFLYEQGTGSIQNRDATYDADHEKWTFPLFFSKVGTGSCLPMFSEKTGGLFCLVISDALYRNNEAFVTMATAIAAAND